MKKITFLLTCLIVTLTYAQTTYTEGFDNETLVSVPQDGTFEGLNNSYFSAIPTGDGVWYTVESFGDTGFQILSTGGNPDNYVGRLSTSQFARAFAYVYNNSDASVTGSYDLSFDYFFNNSFDNGVANARFGVRAWGISTDSSVDGVFALSSGSGNFGDDNATNYTLSSGEGTQLISHTHFAHSDTWTNSGTITVDFGAAGDYEIIVMVFGQVFGTNQAGNPVETYFGVDNVVLPTQSNPVVLSTEDFNKTSLSIYPNPTTDVINIQNLKGEYSYSVYDVAGKLLLNKTNAISTQIDISTLNKGLYLLELVDANNIKSVIKVVKR